MANTTVARRRGSAAWVTPRELMAWLEEGRKMHVVDVRESKEYGASRLPVGVNIPDSTTAQLVKSIPADELTVLVCADGEQSAAVAKTLDFCGFRKVAYLQGGLRDWKAAGGRVVRDYKVESRPVVRPVAVPDGRDLDGVTSTRRMAAVVCRSFNMRVVSVALAASMAIAFLWVCFVG